MSRVCVILVNWNGWADTIECLESLLRSDYEDYRIVLVDNGSGDASLERIKAWAAGDLDVIPGKGAGRFAAPPVAKPVVCAEIDPAKVSAGSCPEDDARLVLIGSRVNLGFAGGNNLALRYLLALGDFDYAWLLNNDTVVAEDAMGKLVARMRERADAGMCGSRLLHYHRPDKIQACGGGYYCKWIGLPWHLGRLLKADAAVDTGRVERWMNYVVGASLLVSRRFIEDVGLMCEDYFLYFEELDWALRGRDRYRLAYADQSIVYHKVGASIGTSSNPAKKSWTCDYFNIRNRLFFTWRFFPYALPSVYLVLLAALIGRICLGQWRRSGMILRLMVNFRNSRFCSV